MPEDGPAPRLSALSRRQKTVVGAALVVAVGAASAAWVAMHPQMEAKTTAHLRAGVRLVNDEVHGRHLVVEGRRAGDAYLVVEVRNTGRLPLTLGPHAPETRMSSVRPVGYAPAPGDPGSTLPADRFREHLTVDPGDTARARLAVTSGCERAPARSRTTISGFPVTAESLGLTSAATVDLPYPVAVVGPSTPAPGCHESGEAPLPSVNASPSGSAAPRPGGG